MRIRHGGEKMRKTFVFLATAFLVCSLQLNLKAAEKSDKQNIGWFFGVLQRKYPNSFFGRDYVQLGQFDSMKIIRIGPFDTEALCKQNQRRSYSRYKELGIADNTYDEVNVTKTFYENQPIQCWEE